MLQNTLVHLTVKPLGPAPACFLSPAPFCLFQCVWVYLAWLAYMCPVTGHEGIIRAALPSTAHSEESRVAWQTLNTSVIITARHHPSFLHSSEGVDGKNYLKHGFCFWDKKFRCCEPHAKLLPSQESFLFNYHLLVLTPFLWLIQLISRNCLLFFVLTVL